MMSNLLFPLFLQVSIINNEMTTDTLNIVKYLLLFPVKNNELPEYSVYPQKENQEKRQMMSNLYFPTFLTGVHYQQ